MCITFYLRHERIVFVEIIDGIKCFAGVIQSDGNDHAQCQSEDEAGKREKELNYGRSWEPVLCIEHTIIVCS